MRVLQRGILNQKVHTTVKIPDFERAVLKRMSMLLLMTPDGLLSQNDQLSKALQEPHDYGCEDVLYQYQSISVFLMLLFLLK